MEKLEAIILEGHLRSCVPEGIKGDREEEVVQGIRESAVSFGAVAGPLLAAFISRPLAPQGIFTVATVTELSAVIPALVVLKLQSQAKAPAEAVASLDTGERIAASISRRSPGPRSHKPYAHLPPG